MCDISKYETQVTILQTIIWIAQQKNVYCKLILINILRLNKTARLVLVPNITSVFAFEKGLITIHKYLKNVTSTFTYILYQILNKTSTGKSTVKVETFARINIRVLPIFNNFACFYFRDFELPYMDLHTKCIHVFARFYFRASWIKRKT